NSAVKRNCADGSVGLPHVRVGHRQTPNTVKRLPDRVAFLRLRRLKTVKPFAQARGFFVGAAFSAVATMK
ncbi:hypothetical protein DU002_10675, partial [Corallincola holothuriorum]